MPWVSERLILKIIYSYTFQKHCKTYPQHFQFQFDSGSLKIPFSKLYVNSCACKLTEPTFRAQITTSGKFQFHI